MLIILTPAGVIMLGGEHIIERSDFRSIALLFFWFLYWSIIAQQFWKNSKLMTKKRAIRRSQMMSIGAVFAILAYVLVVAAQVFQTIAIQIFTQACAVLSGIVFYVGFVLPEWLRKRQKG